MNAVVGRAPGEWRVRTIRLIEYELRDVDDIFDPHSHALLSVGRRIDARRFVVVDDWVHRYHGKRIADYFRHHGITANVEVFPGGEDVKTVDAWQRVLRALDSFPIHRRDEPIIAIGGGVLTDVVGFAASTYRRGVPHIKVPTTLMGYVDAAVGIKTGVNFNDHKNRLGSFEPPRAVFLDRQFLATLAPRHLCNGLAEIIKLAIICDAHLFGLLERFGRASLEAAFQDVRGKEILDRSIGTMLAELAPNLYEDELARKVDFGHTFSYGLETLHGDWLLHGEAVLLDILVSVVVARERGLIAQMASERAFALVARLDLKPPIELLDADWMWQALADRIEHRNGRQRVPLPVAIGQCEFVEDITREELRKCIQLLKRGTSEHGFNRARLIECRCRRNRPLQSHCRALVGPERQNGSAPRNQ